jgi:hypothetical protein
VQEEIMVNNITLASEQYRVILSTCREVFSLAGREFVEPQGVRDLLAKAKEAYTAGDEPTAVKEVSNAQQWLKGVLGKFLNRGIDYFEGRIMELSYMSLDLDIWENLQARLSEYAEVVRQERDSFERRIEAYQKLNCAVIRALPEQRRRNENREARAYQEAALQDLDRRLRKQQREEEDAAHARQQQEAAEAAARERREQEFDALFA